MNSGGMTRSGKNRFFPRIEEGLAALIEMLKQSKTEKPKNRFSKPKKD